MNRPRIIIADKDIDYVIPLQLKFAQEFFDKIDLEIISDENYFDELFIAPQKADILIVSEEFYDSTLQRHNISNIFVMSEQDEEGQTSALNVNTIFKYTSVKEIFNEIVGNSKDVFNIENEHSGETQVVLVYSASGGVGKTTVATGISVCLAKNFKRVLYIDAEYMNLFQRLLKNETPIATSEVYSKFTKADRNIYREIKHVIRNEEFGYLPPFKASLLSLGLEFSIFEKIIESAKASKEFDFIVVDTDSVFNESKMKLFNFADRIIMVTNQTRSSVYSTNMIMQNISGSENGKVVFVCNDFKKDMENAIISPDMNIRFQVSSYISHINHYDQKKCFEIARESGIQELAYLIM